MAKYIDADKLKNNLLQSGAICDFGLFLIEKQSAADVQEVKHGKWILQDNVKYTKCSECGLTRNVETQFAWSYCPNCGAKMYGEKGEQNDT